jgi:hypothetical protein
MVSGDMNTSKDHPPHYLQRVGSNAPPDLSKIVIDRVSKGHMGKVCES